MQGKEQQTHMEEYGSQTIRTAQVRPSSSSSEDQAHLWKWHETAAHHQKVFGAFLSMESRQMELNYAM